MSLGLVAVLVGVSETAVWHWLSPKTIGAIAVGLLLLVFWVRSEARSPHPLVDMQMMRIRGVWTTNAVSLLLGFGMYSSFILLPQYVETPERAGYGFGSSVTQAGLFLVPTTAAMLIVGSQTGRLEKLFGSKPPLLAGGVLTALSFGTLAFARGDRWEIYVAAALLGSGIGLAFAAMANLIIENVGPAQTGIATGMNTVTRTVGGAFGGAATASIIAGTVGANGYPTPHGYTLAFGICAFALAVGVVAGLFIPRAASRRRSSRTRPATWWSRPRSSAARLGRRRPATMPRAGTSGTALEVLEVADDVERPAFDLGVDVADVDADHAEDDQLDAADQGHDDHDRRPAGNGEETGELRDDRKCPTTKLTNETAKPRLSATRSGASEKLVTPVAAKLSIFRSGYLLLAGEALGTPVLDAGLVEADPAEHAADEAAALAHLVEHVESAPVDQAEVAGIERHVDLRDAVEAAVEPGRGRALEPGLAVARPAGRRRRRRSPRASARRAGARPRADPAGRRRARSPHRPARGRRRRSGRSGGRSSARAWPP